MIIDERRGVQVYCPGQASDRQAEASHPLDRAAPGRLRWSDPAAELELLNLAHGGAGQGVQENHVAGVLVAGEAEANWVFRSWPWMPTGGRKLRGVPQERKTQGGEDGYYLQADQDPGNRRDGPDAVD